jgi:outer membrane cobalamin receptor
VNGELLPVSATSASVTILSRESIENSHAGDVGALLRQVPFLFVTESGGRGGLTTVTLRGGKPNFTLVMIDGIPVNDISDTLGGSFDFATLSTDNVDHVEIVRGPLSSVYGSEAVDGVINILSRKGEGTPSAEILGFGGNFGAAQGQLASRGRMGSFAYSTSASYFRIGEQTGNDAFHLLTGGFHSEFAIGPKRILETAFRYQGSHADAFPPNGGGPEFSILRDPQHARTAQAIGSLTFRHQAFRFWTYALSLDVFNRDQNLDAPPILDAVKPTFHSVPSQRAATNFRRYRFGIANSFAIRPRLSAHLNLGERREEGSSQGLLAGTIPDRFALTRSTLGTSAELAYRSGRLTASFGLRYDKTAGFDGVRSPRAGVSYRLAKGLQLRSSWGKGFKLPSFFALGDQTVGNKQLRPEFSNSFDLGISGAAVRGRAGWEATYFQNRYKDLVDFSAATFRLINRSKAVTKGVEVAGTLAATGRLMLSAHFSYLTWELQPSGEPLRDVPHSRGGLQATWNASSRWTWRAETLLVSSRFNFQVPVPGQLMAGGYTSVNLATSYDLRRSVTAFARIENFLNHRYHEFIGFPSAGTVAYVGLSFRIQ